MKRKTLIAMLLTCLATFAVQNAMAQERYLDVTDFRTLPTDMDARIQAPVRDQNGEVCALIKVVANIKGLVFESPALGIVKQEINKGEVWVYIPAGSRTVTILHDDYPTFRNYMYPVKIESATVYEMKITGHREGEGTGSSNAQMLTLNVQPTSASLFIDDEEVPVENGLFTSMMPKGTHTYRIEAKEYEPTSGTIELGDQQWVRSIRLKEKFGFVNVTTYPEAGANVFINDKLVGQTPFKSDNLAPSQYNVRVEKELYFPKDTTAVVNTGGETTDLVFNMTSTIKPKESRKTLIMLDAAMGGGPQTSFGVMVGMAARAGAYLHARTDFGSVSTTRECNDQGIITTTPDGNPLFYKEGSSSKSRLHLTAGYIQRFTLNNPFKKGGMGGLYGFAGAGYGQRILAWETAPDGISTETEWIKNADHSASGVAAEVGGILRMGGFALSLAYSTVQFKYHEVALGVGLFF